MASRKNIQKSCLKLLADVTLYIDDTNIGFCYLGLCWYIFFCVFILNVILCSVRVIFWRGLWLGFIFDFRLLALEAIGLGLISEFACLCPAICRWLVMLLVGNGWLGLRLVRYMIGLCTGDLWLARWLAVYMASC